MLPPGFFGGIFGSLGRGSFLVPDISIPVDFSDEFGGAFSTDDTDYSFFDELYNLPVPLHGSFLIWYYRPYR
jgi:hypothetical protein